MRDIAVFRGFPAEKTESSDGIPETGTKLDVTTLPDADAGSHFHCFTYWEAKPTFGRITEFGNQVAVSYILHSF